MNHGTSWDILQRQVVAWLNISLSAGLNNITLGNAFRSDNVTLLTVCVMQQSDASGTVRVILNMSDLCWHAILVPTLEVDETILTLVTTAAMARSHAAVRVTTTSLAEFAYQRLFRRRTRDLGKIRNRSVATACSRRLINADSHNIVFLYFSRLAFSYQRCQSFDLQPR
ncbi:hypothetical protein GV51_0249 [Gardnerella vaginalis 5-1]|nr:hypothetical protein GV51_0249 [Gardnerella vaginalis 5-1]